VDLFVRFETIHPGIHDHVQEDQIRRMMLEVFHGFLSTGDAAHPVAQLLQYLGGDLALFADIVHDQDELTVPLVATEIFSGFGRLTLCAGGRKIENELRSFSRSTLHIHVTMMVLDGSPDNRHPQPRSTCSHDFLRIEGFEDPLLVFRGNADPRIRHRHHHIITCFHIVVTANGTIDVGIVCTDPDGSSLGHRLSGIGYQVHDALRQMNGRPQGIQQPFFQVGGDHYAIMSQLESLELRTVQVFLDNVIQIDHLCDRYPPSSQGEQIPNNGRRPFAALLDGLDRLPQ